MRRTLCVFNRNRESFLGLRVAPADTWRIGLKGLSEKSGVTPDDGIWLIPSRGIHTIGMRFAVDLIYLDSANRVIYLVEHLGPFRISPIKIKCASILELRSRAIYSSNTQIGDELLICAPEEMKECVEGKDTQPVLPGQARVSEAMFRRAMGRMKGWLLRESGGSQARAEDHASGDSGVLLGWLRAGGTPYPRHQPERRLHLHAGTLVPRHDHPAHSSKGSDGDAERMARRLPRLRPVYPREW